MSINEIRFNPPVKVESSPTKNEEKKKSVKKILSVKFLVTLLVLLFVVFGIIFGVIFGKNIFNFFQTKNNVYNAVFLTNGEVYFGKILKQDDKQIILGEVFYLQANKTETANQSVDNKMILAKLDRQFHGPTDELFINRLQVLFYEELRDNSKVVESIKNYK